LPRKNNGLGKHNSRPAVVRLSHDFHKRWDAYCKRYSTTATEGLRGLMRYVMDQDVEMHDALNKLVGSLMIERDRQQRGELATKGERVAQVLADADEAPRRTTSDTVETGKKVRIEIKLTASEGAAVAEAAQERGCSSQNWITSMVRASLTHGPLMGAEEMRLLGESNYQLTAIGRNLNQITRQINADPERHLHRVTAEGLEKLVRRIVDHRYSVHRFLHLSSHRWALIKPS